MDLIYTLQASELLANDTGANIRVVNVTSPTPRGGSVVLNAETITYTLDRSNLYYFGGTDTFDYTISDGTQTSTATVTLTLPSSNTLPEVQELPGIPGANARITANTLVGTYQNLTITAVEPIDNCYVSFLTHDTDYGDYVLFNRIDATLPSTFQITARTATGEFRTLQYLVPKFEEVGQTGPEDQQPNGGYLVRRGKKAYSPSDLLNTVYPINTRFMVQEYDVDFTDRMNLFSNSFTTIADMVQAIEDAAYVTCSFENGVIVMTSLDGGHYDVAYRLGGTSNWLHADKLFDGPSATDRPSTFTPFYSGGVDPAPDPAGTVPGSGGATYINGAIRQVGSQVGDSLIEVRMPLAPAQGSMLVAIGIHFREATVRTSDGWTTLQNNTSNSLTRDGTVFAYKIAGTNESKSQFPFGVGDIEDAVTIFELPIAAGSILTPFAAHDLSGTSYSHTEQLDPGEYVIGAAFTVSGEIATVDGGIPILEGKAKLSRATVQPFYAPTSTTVTMNVVNEVTNRLIYGSVRVTG